MCAPKVIGMIIYRIFKIKSVFQAQTKVSFHILLLISQIFDIIMDFVLHVDFALFKIIFYFSTREHLLDSFVCSRGFVPLGNFLTFKLAWPVC